MTFGRNQGLLKESIPSIAVPSTPAPMRQPAQSPILIGNVGRPPGPRSLSFTLSESVSPTIS